ncbi:MAG: cytochrome c maturation protein CcmE [Caldilineaceae bacterium]|nr:cytochrome c maturation protein CcmE [Caldilineaceae bacterium]
MTRKQRRLTLIAAAGAVLAVAVGLVLYAFQDTIVFFTTPSELQAKPAAPGTRLRLGGLVEDGSVVRGTGTAVSFTITDTEATVPVVYEGTLPDLFREGQGVVAEGRFDSEGVFVADTVLAKHDENYMPREVADALKEKGVWKSSQ